MNRSRRTLPTKLLRPSRDPEGATSRMRRDTTRPSSQVQPSALDNLQDAIGNQAVASLLTERALGLGTDQVDAIEGTLARTGRPIDPTTRSLMEARFGQDFSHVRLHDGPEASASAATLGAEAYTLGSDIVLGHGAAPNPSPVGLHLLAHELAHVVQQETPRPPTNGVAVAPVDTPAEHAADAAAARVGSGRSAPALSLGSAPATAIQRKPAKGSMATKPAPATSAGEPDVTLDADPATGRYTVIANGKVVAQGTGPVGGEEIVAAGFEAKFSPDNGGTFSLDIRTTPNITLDILPDAGSAFPGINEVNITVKQVQPRIPLIREGPPKIDLFEPENAPEPPPPEVTRPRKAAPRPKPRPRPAPEPEGVEWEDVGEYVHGALDLAGLVPGFGEVADGINAIIYLSEGRYAEAAISAAGMIPIVGDVGKAGKWGAKAAREASEELVERGGREAVGELTERRVRETAAEVGGEATEAAVRETVEEAPALAGIAGRETAEQATQKAATTTPPALAKPAKPKRRRRRRKSDRPRLKRGKKAARLPASRFRKFTEALTGQAAKEQDRVLQLHKRDPLEAGKQYQDLVARNLRAADVQEMFKRAGRRMDVGKTHEVTLEGMRRGLGTHKLDQLWLDLKDRGEVLLTVPKLSKQAADQLARLGAQVEQEFGKEVLIIVRETLP